MWKIKDWMHAVQSESKNEPIRKSIKKIKPQNKTNTSANYILINRLVKIFNFLSNMRYYLNNIKKESNGNNLIDEKC